MTPVKDHYIDIYRNQTLLKIGEEMHIVYLSENVPKLAKGERLRLDYDGWIAINDLKHFEPSVQSLVEATEFYSKGDRLCINPELGYIEKCLTRLFKDTLRKEELREKIDDNLHLLTGAIFYLEEPTPAFPTIELPDFPTKEPTMTFSPAGSARCFHFPEPKIERKSKKKENGRDSCLLS